MNIRTTHIRQVDLNLLVYFAVLAEEANISRAAERLRLSQPSMSRALQRLRRMFNDELLLRGAQGYELTPKGTALLRELADVLPRLDQLLAGETFDPQREAARFRIAATDHTTHHFAGVLSRRAAEWSRVVFDFLPWSDDLYNELDRGLSDLLLTAQDGLLPGHLRGEFIYDEEVVCVVDKNHPLNGRISFRQYAAGRHVEVVVYKHAQSYLQRELATRGIERNNVLFVPYFSVALHAIPGTDLMTSVPRRFARALVDPAKAKVLTLPREISRFKYLMVWHPRVDKDVQHRWLRQAIREASREIQPLR